MYNEEVFKSLLAYPMFRSLGIKMQLLVNGSTHALIVTGESGTGKTTFVKGYLESQNLLEGRGCRMPRGHLTINGLLQVLQLEPDGILVLDDCDHLLHEKGATDIFKALLDDKPRRVISKITHSHSRGGSVEFEYRGRVIFISNFDYSSSSNINLSAIANRCHIVTYHLNPKEKIDYIRQLVLPREYKGTTLELRSEVLAKFERTVMRTRAKFSIRDFLKIVDYALVDPSGVQDELKRSFQLPDIQQKYEELHQNDLTVEKNAKRFMEATGYSRRTYFNLRRKLAEHGEHTDV